MAKNKNPFVSLYFQLTIKNSKKLETLHMSSIGGNIAKEEPVTFEDMCSRVVVEILKFYTWCYSWSIGTQVKEAQRLIDRLQVVVDDAKKENKDDED